MDPYRPEAVLPSPWFHPQAGEAWQAPLNRYWVGMQVLMVVVGWLLSIRTLSPPDRVFGRQALRLKPAVEPPQALPGCSDVEDSLSDLEPLGPEFSEGKRLQRPADIFPAKLLEAIQTTNKRGKVPDRPLSSNAIKPGPEMVWVAAPNASLQSTPPLRRCLAHH